MSIRTEAIDKPTYVRILDKPQSGWQGESLRYVGKVGIARAKGATDLYPKKLIFVDVHGEQSLGVFNEEDVEYITKKEYFIGALSG